MSKLCEDRIAKMFGESKMEIPKRTFNVEDLVMEANVYDTMYGEPYEDYGDIDFETFWEYLFKKIPGLKKAIQDPKQVEGFTMTPMGKKVEKELKSLCDYITKETGVKTTVYDAEESLYNALDDMGLGITL